MRNFASAILDGVGIVLVVGGSAQVSPALGWLTGGAFALWTSWRLSQ